MVQRFRSQLQDLSKRTGTDLASLTAAFVLLHEVTAVIPLVLFFYLFGLLGAGQSLCLYFLRAAQEADDDGTTAAQWKRYIGRELEEGMYKVERYARRKGWWGYEEGSQDQVVRYTQREIHNGDVDADAMAVGNMANAIAAYVATKVSVGKADGAVIFVCRKKLKVHGCWLVDGSYVIYRHLLLRARGDRLLD